MDIKIEGAMQYLDKDLGQLEATREDLLWAAVAVEDGVSSLLALFRDEKDARQYQFEKQLQIWRKQ